MAHHRILLIHVISALFAIFIASAHAEVQHREPTTPKRWILLPLNVEEVPPEYLADGAEILDGVLAAELTRRNVDFVQLTLVEGLRRWERASNSISERQIESENFDEESFERAQLKFVESLLEEFDATGVIWPDVLERKAKKVRRSLVWDGVGRIIPGPLDVRRVRSPESGSSLRIRVYDSNGTLVSDAYRGLEPIHHFRVVRRESNQFTRTFWGEFPIRVDLFEDRTLLNRAARKMLADDLW